MPASAGAASAASVAVGFFISEVALPWFWEDRRERRELNAVHQRFREPLCLAARELASRTTEILENYLSGAKPYPPKFLRRKNLAVTASRQELTTDKDPYFVRYKLISTLYRFCAFCGWIELYRQELTFLRAANSKKTRALRAAIQAIRTDLADGHLNEADNWPDWRDLLILREEQRAVGEAMLEERGDKRVVMGYGRFCESARSCRRFNAEDLGAAGCRGVLPHSSRPGLQKCSTYAAWHSSDRSGRTAGRRTVGRTV